MYDRMALLQTAGFVLIAIGIILLLCALPYRAWLAIAGVLLAFGGIFLLKRFKCRK